jgi:hypothetical protein
VIQRKDRKSRNYNTDKKMKAPFRGRGFHQHSKIINKSKNSTLWIIEYNKRNCILFFRLKRGERNG